MLVQAMWEFDANLGYLNIHIFFYIILNDKK